jgi:hypothetical protein
VGTVPEEVTVQRKQPAGASPTRAEKQLTGLWWRQAVWEKVA